MPGGQPQSIFGTETGEEADNGILHRFQAGIQMIGADLVLECPSDLFHWIGLVTAVGGQVTHLQTRMIRQPSQGQLALVDTGIVHKQHDRRVPAFRGVGSAAARC